MSQPLPQMTVQQQGGEQQVYYQTILEQAGPYPGLEQVPYQQVVGEGQASVLYQSQQSSVEQSALIYQPPPGPAQSLQIEPTVIYQQPVVEQPQVLYQPQPAPPEPQYQEPVYQNIELQPELVTGQFTAGVQEPVDPLGRKILEVVEQQQAAPPVQQPVEMSGLSPSGVVSNVQSEVESSTQCSTREKSVEGSQYTNTLQLNEAQKEAVKDFSDALSVTDSDAGHLEGEGKAGKERKRTKKERKRTNLGPRIKVLRLVTGEDGEELDPGELEAGPKTGVKVECQMETSKQKTVTFEFSTTDIVPEEMASTFIREDLLAEEHRKILVEQLVDIVNQLTSDPDKLPHVSFPPEECFSPTRDKRDASSDAPKQETAASPAALAPADGDLAPPVRGAEKPPEVIAGKVKKFHISPVVENKPLLGAGELPLEKRDSSTATTPQVVPTHVDQGTTTSPYHEVPNLDKLDISKPPAGSLMEPSKAQLSPSSQAPTQVVHLTSPESHHMTSSHPSNDVSDLEANLASILFNKQPPAAPIVAQGLAGIVPLEQDQSGSSSGSVPVSVIQSYSEASEASLPVVLETDSSNTVHSNKSLEDLMGEPVKHSTPDVTPEKFQEMSTSGPGRFEVKKVEDVMSEEPELLSLAQQRAAAAAEAEHYDSSPSPGSCYDTASESVEPSLGAGPHCHPQPPLHLPQVQSVPAHHQPRRPSHSWPSTWPDTSRAQTSLADTTARMGQLVSHQVEEHHTSGDSIPVGFEASHLNQTQDSGIDRNSMGSSVNSQHLQHQHHQQQLVIQQPQMTALYAQDQQVSRLSASRQDNFCPIPESTFIPVEPAKDPPLDVESVEEDHNTITEEECFIDNALKRLDVR